MQEVYFVADNITSPIGYTTEDNFLRISKNISGISLHDNQHLSGQPFYASLFSKNDHIVYAENKYTRFENLLIASITDAIEKGGIDPEDPETILILSSTKGNIELLEEHNAGPDLFKRIALHSSARLIADHFGFVNQPIVISNACISGVLGILVAKRLLSAKQYKTAVVAGADVVSKFILSGFQSFQAVSPEPCAPFDKDRKGITLGEAAATVVLSAEHKYAGNIQVLGGGQSNDANHISAPSRTGEELAYIMTNALRESGLLQKDIGFISAHGTATLFNDEMETKAITLAGMPSVPVNSLKGYFGHTLGAAGLLESIISVQSLRHDVILPTKNFKEADASIGLNISSELLYTPLQNCLKTASGFGGCNAAVVFSKQPKY